MDCYRVLRDRTEPFKRRMLSYNAYIGQRQRPMERWDQQAKNEAESEANIW